MCFLGDIINNINKTIKKERKKERKGHTIFIMKRLGDGQRKKTAEIEGVSSKHIVELKSLVSQGDGSLKRKAEEPAFLPKRLKLASAGRERAEDKRENPGVEQRRARDEEVLSLLSSRRSAVVLSDEQKIALSRAMMEKKAAKYAKCVRGEEELPKDKEGRDDCLVDFSSKRLLEPGMGALGLWGPKSSEASIYADPGDKDNGRKRESTYDDLDKDDDYYYERVADRETQRNIEAQKIIEEQTRKDKEIVKQKKKELLKEKNSRIAKIKKLRTANTQMK